MRVVTLAVAYERDISLKTFVQLLKILKHCQNGRTKILITCNSSKEYETVRQQHEDVKQRRDQAKEELKNLKEMQSPLTKKIRELEESYNSLNMKIRNMVSILSSQLKYSGVLCSAL